VEGTVVDFKVIDPDGNPIPQLPAGTTISFTFNKLVSDAVGNTQWVIYINREGAITGANKVGPGGAPAITTPVRQATTQNATDTVVNLGGGNYRYTFTATGLTTTNFPAPVPFEANVTNRIGMQVGAGGLKPCNYVHDFVPADPNNEAAVVVTRNIATTASCLECHAKNFGFHHSGNRKEVEYCVTCHNPGSTDPNSGETSTGDHGPQDPRRHKLPSVKAGRSFIIWGTACTHRQLSRTSRTACKA
jgi:OmcA/MtrC family decaheme c-type cytochrome